MAASTVALPASAAHLIPKPYEASFMGTPLTAALATTSMDDVADTVELGYIPANTTLLGYFVQAGALAASALVYKIQVAGVDSVTGITTGGAGAAAGALFLLSAPLPITTPSKVSYVVTTVATTPAAGNLSVTPLLANN
jgi:hypothetical protein